MKRAVITVLALAAAITVAVSDGEQFKTVDFGRSVMDSSSTTSFDTVSYRELPSPIRSMSENFCRIVLADEAAPHDSPTVDVSRFNGTREGQLDVLRYRWTVDGIIVEARETANGLDIRFPVERARQLVPRVLRLAGTDTLDRDYRIEVPWPDELADGVSFSTNPDKSLLGLRTWHDRIDFYVERRTLHALVYRKNPQRLMFEDGSVWFEGYAAAP